MKLIIILLFLISISKVFCSIYNHFTIQLAILILSVGDENGISFKNKNGKQEPLKINIDKSSEFNINNDDAILNELISQSVTWFKVFKELSDIHGANQAKNIFIEQHLNNYNNNSDNNNKSIIDIIPALKEIYDSCINNGMNKDEAYKRVNTKNYIKKH